LEKRKKTLCLLQKRELTQDLHTILNTKIPKEP
jgi:hypothetical protein